MASSTLGLWEQSIEPIKCYSHLLQLTLHDPIWMSLANLSIKYSFTFFDITFNCYCRVLRINNKHNGPQYSCRVCSTEVRYRAIRHKRKCSHWSYWKCQELQKHVSVSYVEWRELPSVVAFIIKAHIMLCVCFHSLSLRLQIKITYLSIWKLILFPIVHTVHQNIFLFQTHNKYIFFYFKTYFNFYL